MASNAESNPWHFITLYGVLLWAIPFCISCLLVQPDGTKVVSEAFFKTIMIVVSTAAGSYFLAKFHQDFAHVQPFPLGVCIGSVWLLINWGLDYLILIPLLKTDVQTYFMTTGLRYLGMLFQCLCVDVCVGARMGAGSGGKRKRN